MSDAGRVQMLASAQGSAPARPISANSPGHRDWRLNIHIPGAVQLVSLRRIVKLSSRRHHRGYKWAVDLESGVGRE